MAQVSNSSVWGIFCLRTYFVGGKFAGCRGGCREIVAKIQRFCLFKRYYFTIDAPDVRTRVKKTDR